MKFLGRSLNSVVGRAALLALTLGVGVTTLHAAINAVYVNANIGTVSNANVVLGYNNDGSGNLTPLPGSPYLTGGTGSAPAPGVPLGLQQDNDDQVVINSGGSFLATVNGFSNTVSMFTLNADGSLVPVAGSPFVSGGPEPVAIGLLDNALGNGTSYMVVVNHQSDPNQTNTKNPNFQVFSVDPAGVMTHVTGSQVTLPFGASPSQAAVGQFHLVFGMQFAGGSSTVPSQIYSYRMQLNGKMKLNQTVVAPTGNVFLGEYVHPTQTVLYAALPATNQVAVYTYAGATGLLTLQTQVATTGALPCWLTMNAAGTRLYTGNTMDNTIDVFDTTVATAPVFLQHIALKPTTAGSGVTNMKFDPTGQFLYALSNSSTSSSLHVFNANADGTLVENLSPLTLPVPSGNFPLGLATVQK
jgi:6-phosphogluconolactonase (cycloisomerase 2 family)